MPRRKKLPPKPYGTKWSDVYDLLNKCRAILNRGDSGEVGRTTDALRLAEQALNKAGLWCHRADRARSMGLTIERSIRDNVFLPLQDGESHDSVIGAISSLLEVIEREAGMAIYRANQRREVDLIVAGFIDDINKAVVERFNKLVQEAITAYPDPRKKRRRR